MPNKLLSNYIAILLASLLLMSMQAHSAGELINPTNEKYFMPKTGINTKELPDIQLKASDSKDKPLPFYKLTDNTYLLMGKIDVFNDTNRGWTGNAGFIVTSDGVIAIDSLGTPKLGHRMIATIRTVTKKPIKYLVVTHNHPDHYFGASAYRAIPGLKIVAHAITYKYNESETYVHSVDLRERTYHSDDMKGVAKITPDIPIGGKPLDFKTVKLGGVTLNVYNLGNHHSYGDLVVEQIEKSGKIVWVSDLAFNNRLAYMGDGNNKRAIIGQKWLLEKFKDARYMIPGHGSAQTAPFKMVSRTLKYMAGMRKLMFEMIDDEKDLVDAVDIAETSFPEWKNDHLYKHNHRRNANFLYRDLEEELLMDMGNEVEDTRLSQEVEQEKDGV